MQLPDWLEQLTTLVPEGAPVGTRHRIETTTGSGAGAHRIAAEALIDRHGQRRERFWCDGARLQRHELLRLTCPETECPQAKALRAQWQAFVQRRHGPAAVARRAAVVAAAPAALMQEHLLQMAGQTCTARPAVFRCFTHCPHGAHPPLWIDQRGFDLFEDGVCIGGGLATDRAGTRPRIPTLQAAQAWLTARALEASAALAALAERR